LGIKELRRPLTGTAFRIYFLLINSRRPMGVREIQRLVGLKSASTVKYHLDRLAMEGLVRQLPDGKYVGMKSDNPALTGYFIIMNTPIPYLIPAAVGYAAFVTTYSILSGFPDPVLIGSSIVFTAYVIYEALRTRSLIKYLSRR